MKGAYDIPKAHSFLSPETQALSVAIARKSQNPEEPEPVMGISHTYSDDFSEYGHYFAYLTFPKMVFEFYTSIICGARSIMAFNMGGSGWKNEEGYNYNNPLPSADTTFRNWNMVVKDFMDKGLDKVIFTETLDDLVEFKITQFLEADVNDAFGIDDDDWPPSPPPTPDDLPGSDWLKAQKDPTDFFGIDPFADYSLEESQDDHYMLRRIRNDDGFHDYYLFYSNIMDDGDTNQFEYYKTVEFSLPLEGLWDVPGELPEYIHIEDVTPLMEVNREWEGINGSSNFVRADYVPIHNHPEFWQEEIPTWPSTGGFGYSHQWLEGDLEDFIDGETFTFSDNVSELYTAIYKIVPTFYCPIVYVQSDPDSDYMPENNTLPQTMDSDLQGSIVEDYLRINLNQPKDINGNYQLRVRELQSLREEFDYFGLMGVDRSEDEKAGVASGRYFTYDPNDAVAPISAVTFEGEDIRVSISSVDDEEFVAEGSGGVILTFSEDHSGEVIIEMPEQRKDPRCFANVERWNGSEWEFVGLLQPRIYPTSQLFLFEIESDESLIIQITWEDHFKADYICLHSDITEIIPSIFPVTSAIHSDSSDVLALLQEQDAQYVSILLDEYIDLEFTADDGPAEGLVRDFFFVTNGYFLQAWFVSVSDSAGIDIPGSGWRGVTWCDYNGDGWQDAGIAYSSRYYLYRNNQDGTFTAVDESLGIHQESYVIGGIFGDYDNDGDEDFYMYGQMLTSNKSHLYRNDAELGFVDVTDSAGVPTGSNVFRASWIDYNNDGYLDIYAINYPSPVLYRNNGDGTFNDVTAEAGLVFSASVGHSGIWGDYNNDGWSDLYVTGYSSTARRLFMNNGDGSFTNVTATALSGIRSISEHGAIWADFNNDGFIDLYITSPNNADLICINNGDGTFYDNSLNAGITEGYGGVSSGAADYDNDGDMDIYTSMYSGNPNVLYNNGDGTFVNIGEGSGVVVGGICREKAKTKEIIPTTGRLVQPELLGL